MLDGDKYFSSHADFAEFLSQHLINSMAMGLDEGKKRKIFCENAGNLYGFI